MNKSFSVKEAILYSVHALVEHPWYFLKLFFQWIAFSVMMLLPIFSLIGLMALYGTVEPTHHLSFVVLALTFLAAYLLALVYIWSAPTKLLLRFYDTSSAQISFGEFFRLFSVSKLFSILGVFVLYATIICLGLILFIIPGIYLAIKLQFALYYMIDKNISVTQALKKSYAATTGNFWRILLVGIIAALLMNLIITIPLSYLLGVYMYRKLG